MGHGPFTLLALQFLSSRLPPAVADSVILPGLILVNRPLAPRLVFLFVVPCLPARVTPGEIAARTDVLDAKPFGESGPYERIAGRVYFTGRVGNIHNQSSVDRIH